LTEDDDPLDQCAGHGTHVAGIIAADARNANASQPFVGVAPGVTIFAYRIFGCTGTTTNDIIIDAITRAFFDDVDIVSMSLGAPNGWSEDPGAVVANRLAEKGVFASIAAGNDGAAGLLDSSSPATGPDILSVASVDNSALVAWNALTSLNQSVVLSRKSCLLTCQGYFLTNPFPAGGPYKLYITAKTDADLAADACQPLPPDTPDLSQFLVLTRRGKCFFTDKIKHLEAAGAKVILYFHVRSLTDR
jgi:subtilisin family serine protease